MWRWLSRVYKHQYIVQNIKNGELEGDGDHIEYLGDTALIQWRDTPKRC